MNPKAVLFLVVLSLPLMAGAPPLLDAQSTQPASDIHVSTPEEIAQDFAQMPCNNKERLNAVKRLFEKMEAPADSISIEKASGVENILVRKPGMSEDTIVVGAHYDFADLGCGAVDNWTGIVAVTHLYRTIQKLMTRKTFVFAAFGKEESGLIGSKKMVQAISKDQLPRYCAMINIDSFGLGATPLALEGSSSKKLLQAADDVAKAMPVPFSKLRINGADSDSSSFIARNIPAITLSGVSEDWQSILHTTKDQVGMVKPENVYLGYRFALALAARVDEAACDSYR